MNSCAYCGKSIETSGFICDACSDPNKQKIEEPAPKSINTVEKILEQPEPVETVVSVPENKPIEAVKEITEEPISEVKNELEESNPYLPDNWSDQPIHQELAYKKTTFVLIFVVVPLLCLGSLGALTSLDAIFRAVAVITTSFVFALSLAAYTIEIRWLKFASYVLKTAEATEAYIFLESNSPVVISIYNEDSMYPEFEGLDDIHPKTGNIELLGVNPKKMKELVPVSIKLGSYGKVNVLILEAKGRRVWCKFQRK